MLNQRQKKLIEFLQENQGWRTGKEIALFLGVSSRTIRSDINKINQCFSKRIILSNCHKGYFLKENFSVESILKDQISISIPQTPIERSSFIIKRLLLSNNKEINIVNLENEIFVSESSLESDLRRVRKRIAGYSNLKLVRSKHFIRLEGNEEEKRKLYKVLLEEEINGDFLNMDRLASLYNEFDLLKIKNIFENVLDDYEFHVRYIFLPMIMIHIGIALVRRLHHHNIQNSYSVDFDFKQSIEYKVAQSFFLQIEREINVKIPESEMIQLAVLLSGKKNSQFKKHDEMLRCSLLSVTNQLLQSIFERFGLDLRYDEDLKFGLELHIQGIIERKKQNIKVSNIYLQEIKQKYPLVFEMGVWSGKVLSELLEVQISEDDLGFLSLHLGSAYERSFSNKFRALLVYPEEQMISKMFYDKLNKLFQDRMSVIGHINSFEKKKVLEFDPDLIITTVPLNHTLTIPTIQLSLFMNSTDETKIFYLLNDLEKKKKQKMFETFVRDIFYPELFYPELNLDTPEEIIYFLCDKMRRKNFIPNEFQENVLKREMYSPTSMSCGLAVPHALNVVANRSSISVAILKNKVLWGSIEVSLVILLAIRDEDKELMSVFFDWLSNITENTEKLNQILEIKEYSKFIESISF